MTPRIAATNASAVSRKWLTIFFEDYKARNPKSETFADYALGHVKRLIGKLMVSTSTPRR